MIASVELIDNSRTLLFTSKTGQTSALGAALLRKSALDAKSRRARFLAAQDDEQHVGPHELDADIKIIAINRMGTTGLNIEFSDGHDRAIYPYPYLNKLAFGIDN